jgi:hypothetical protein
MPTSPIGLLNQTLTYAPRSSINEYNKPTYGTGVSLQVRTEEVTERITKNGIEELVPITIAYVESKTGTVITSEGKITLTDGTTPPILAVESVRSRLGIVSFYKVWLGDTRIR